MSKRNYIGYLAGANPKNPIDEWVRAVLMLVSHSNDITVGIQINRMHPDLSLAPIAARLGIEHAPDYPIYVGGDNQPNKIHVIHSLDWQGLTTLPLNNWVGITNDVSVLAALAKGEGPQWVRACAGFKLWESGQFDLELSSKSSKRNNSHYNWVLAPGTLTNTFNLESDHQWQHVLEESAKLAVDIWFAD